MKQLKLGYYFVRIALLLVGLFFGGYAWTTFLEVI